MSIVDGDFPRARPSHSHGSGGVAGGVGPAKKCRVCLISSTFSLNFSERRSRRWRISVLMMRGILGYVYGDFDGLFLS